MFEQTEFAQELEDSDEEGIGVRRFVPIKLPNDFDPNKVPATGEEFLHYAIYEARKCDAIAKAEVKPKSIKKKIDYSPTAQYIHRMSEKEIIAQTHPALLPTENWVKENVANFQEFRKYIQAMLPNASEVSCGPPLLNLSKTIDEGNPKFSVVSNFNPATLYRLTQILVNRLKNVKHGSTVADKEGIWIYAILALLRVPLLPADHNNLRDIATECAGIRSRLPQDAASELYEPLNVFICIVIYCFGQTDLIDLLSHTI